MGHSKANVLGNIGLSLSFFLNLFPSSADDGLGAWCYVDPACSDTCTDLRPSDRFHKFSWSYQACRRRSGFANLHPSTFRPGKSRIEKERERFQIISNDEARGGRLPPNPPRLQSNQLTPEEDLVGKLAEILRESN